MRWHAERLKLQNKNERGHFGITWSVLAAVGIATALLLAGWHPRTSGMIDLQFVGIVVFIVVGFFGFYMTLAVAMRWWPHNRRKRDVVQYENVKRLYLDGYELYKQWGERVLLNQTLHNECLMDSAAYDIRDKDFEERAKNLVDWRDRADHSIVSWFDSATCRTFITEPEISQAPPDWRRGDQWFTNWDQIVGRLTWLRRWLLGQDDL
jgi:hypothetical protein